ncbi:MAG TPA: FecR family protein [Steroidobacteraceae bacterium]|nr:FecR family protein [Steroidobacteraceae bacterium]
MNEPQDLVESLVRSAGRRTEPPEEDYRRVLAAATAAFREKTARRRERLWVLWAGAAAVLALAVALMFQWTPPGAQREQLARIERAIGAVERATGDVWQPIGESTAPLTKGIKLRTLAGGRAGLVLAGGASLRLAAGTEIMLDEPGRLYLREGTLYLDHRGSVGTGYRIETPAGTARDLGTQFELQVRGSALRLRVREGRVEIDRAGQRLEGAAGEQLELDALGSVKRSLIAAGDAAWQWAEAIAPTPDVDGRPAAELIAWVARETGRRLRYESAAVEQRAATVILHGNIRHLPPLAALDAVLATTDLEYVLAGDTMEIRARAQSGP